MAHNSLRRAIQAHLSDGGLNPADSPTALLMRALTALGGPVQDNRPQVVTPSTPNVDTTQPTENAAPQPIPATIEASPTTSYIDDAGRVVHCV